MKKQTFGEMLAALRKEKSMTQLDLAEKMGVTDKAVSKWERDLSFPDINSLPKLAEIFGLSVDELMRVKTDTKENTGKNRLHRIIDTILKAIGAAMGIAVTVLSVLGQADANTTLPLLGIGLACISIALLKNEPAEK